MLNLVNMYVSSHSVLVITELPMQFQYVFIAKSIETAPGIIFLFLMINSSRPILDPFEKLRRIL